MRNVMQPLIPQYLEILKNGNSGMVKRLNTAESTTKLPESKQCIQWHQFCAILFHTYFLQCPSPLLACQLGLLHC